MMIKLIILCLPCCLSVYLFVCMYVYLFICVCVCLSVFSVCLSVCLSLSLSLCPPSIIISPRSGIERSKTEGSIKTALKKRRRSRHAVPLRNDRDNEARRPPCDPPRPGNAKPAPATTHKLPRHEQRGLIRENK